MKSNDDLAVEYDQATTVAEREKIAQKMKMNNQEAIDSLLCHDVAAYEWMIGKRRQANVPQCHLALNASAPRRSRDGNRA